MTDDERNHFIDVKPKKTCFGGAELIKAMYYTKKMNILVFNENSEYYFSLQFNPNFDRTMVVAYRLNGKSIRDHYESWVEIDENELYDCARYLAEVECKRQQSGI